jgi:membrane protein
MREIWDVARAAAKRFGRAQANDRAAGVAYYGFLAIPALLLIIVGTYGTVASPADVTRLTDRMGTVAPAEVSSFLNTSLTRIVEAQATGPLLIIMGLLLALWTASGAMSALIRALNAMYDVEESRGFLRQRLVAVGLLGLLLGSMALVMVMLIAGPVITGWIGDTVGAQSLVSALWWTLQWPLLIVALLAAFAGILRLGPNRERPPSRLLAPGGIAAVALWLIASSGFALYVALSGSLQRTWGPIASVVVVLMWLWVSGLSLLAGAAVDAEVSGDAEAGSASDPAHRPA